MTNSRKARIRRQRQRRALLTMALVLVTAFACISGTIAWLTATSGEVVNTFTVGDIDIVLDETTGETYKIIPGTDIEKDPFVKVETGSEKCYVFVKVEENAWPPMKESDGNTLKVAYSIDSAWTELGNNVYYRIVDTADQNKELYILTKNTVTVSDNLTKGEVAQITTNPTLKFTAYAIQFENMEDAADAWAKLNG